MCQTEEICVAMPGLRAGRWYSDQLYYGVKEAWSLVYVEQGASTFQSWGKTQSAGPGWQLVKRPGDVHRDLWRSGSSVFQIITLPDSAVERLAPVKRIGALFAPEDARGAAYVRLHHAVRAGADRLALEVAVAEAVTAIGGLEGGSNETRPVRRAIELLRERLAEPVTLDDLAAHADLDKYHLCRAFREQVGMPPHAYLTRLRIWRAKDLLKSGMKPSAVAPQVGLYDQSQLNRHFRRIVGVTPGEFVRASAPGESAWASRG